MGEKTKETLKLQFDRRLRLEFHGARITSDAGLLACRELDGVLRLAELEHLHISIGINHSMVEDPALLMVLGMNGFWLWVPKLVMAAITVQVFRGVEYLKNRVGRGPS